MAKSRPKWVKVHTVTATLRDGVFTWTNIPNLPKSREHNPLMKFVPGNSLNADIKMVLFERVLKTSKKKKVTK